MATWPQQSPDDSIVVIDETPVLLLEEWLTLLGGDEPVDEDLNVAEIVREIRQSSER